MTNAQKEFVKKMQIYFATKDDTDYRNTMKKAQTDKNFENMIQSMTVDRLAGKSSLAKNKIQF